MKRRAVFLVFSMLALSIPNGVPQASEFQVVGPGGGGAMFHATISPHDSNEVLVACDMTGAYISHDGGASWRMFSLRGPIKFFAFDPLRPSVIYAANGGLWRSNDDGKSWNLVWPKPETVMGVTMKSDHADETILSNDNPLGEIVALAVDPGNSQILTAGAVKDGVASVYVSNDDGRNWEKIASLFDVPNSIGVYDSEPLFLWIDPHSPAASRDLYVAGKQSITVRHLGKWERRPAPAGVSFIDVSVGFASPDRVFIYAASDSGRVYVSHNGGSSWSASRLPGEGAQVRAIATSLNSPKVAYASYSKLRLGAGSWMGVVKTQDGGLTWSLVWKDALSSDWFNKRELASNVHDAWIGQELGPDWAGNPLGLAVENQNPNLVYATDYGRTLKSTDGGANWQAVYSRRSSDSSWTSTGLDVTTAYGYLFDPFNPLRRFIPTTDIGLFRSEDGGRSWIRSMNGVPRSWDNTAYWVAFDPNVKDKMWGVMSYTHDLPRPKMWRSNAPANYRGGVCVSLDGGRTWKPSNEGMAETAPTHILLDPSSPVGKRVLWVAAMGRGVYKSTDDGATWALKNNGIGQIDPLAWRFSRGIDGTLYVVIARRSEDGSIGKPGDGALYKSTDGAESWKPVPLPSGTNGPTGLAVDPRDPKRLFLAAWARAAEAHVAGGGIFLSTDGGETWKCVLDRDEHIYDVTIDPRDANVLYASGFESTAWISKDSGEHWTRIPGFNFKWGHRVMPDLSDPGMIFISTFGGGVWHGPKSGAEGHRDVATPVLQLER